MAKVLGNTRRWCRHALFWLTFARRKTLRAKLVLLSTCAATPGSPLLMNLDPYWMARQILSLVSALFRYMTRKASSALVISNDAISSSNRIPIFFKGIRFPWNKKTLWQKRRGGKKERRQAVQKTRNSRGKKNRRNSQNGQKSREIESLWSPSDQMRRKKMQSDDVPRASPSLSLPYTTVVTTSFSFVALGNDEMDGWARYRLLIGRFSFLLTVGLCSVCFSVPQRWTRSTAAMDGSNPCRPLNSVIRVRTELPIGFFSGPLNRVCIRWFCSGGATTVPAISSHY